jgi:hypothetical protein
MPNYKESAVSGTQWTRAYSVELNNPYQGVPSIKFNEEQVIQLSDHVAHQPPATGPAGLISVNFTDPNATFTLLDPATDVMVGTATYGQVYALIYSLYKATALARDQRLGI